jgi:2-polyprenyl-3-methyl-5-hydroxy-6-metoxy-1,4-benzoquinol methylase
MDENTQVSMIDYICILCKKRQLTEFLLASSDDDKYTRLSSDKSVYIIKCNYCELVQSIPQINIQDYHNNDSNIKNLISNDIDYDLLYPKFIDDTNRHFQMINNIIHDEISIESSKYLSKKLTSSDSIDDSFNQSNTNINILDIGCNYGFLVNKLTKNGYNATGISFSTMKSEFIDEYMEGDYVNYNIDLSQSNQESEKIFDNDDFNEKYDIICLFNTLCYTTDFTKLIKSCKSLLKENGHIIIEESNTDDENINIIPEYKNHYYQISKLVYFNKQSFTILMDNLDINSYKIFGIQRYSIENFINWIEHKIPQLYKPSFITTNPIYKPLDDFFKKNKEKTLTCDTLLLLIQNK